METIRYALRDTSLGTLLVGMSDAGVVSADLGQDQARLLDSLARRFPRADIQHAGERDDAWADAVAEHVERPLQAGPVPLDLRGTEFQRSVWGALLDIPAGETRSYSEVAGSIGRPTAVRAVAQACGANPVGYVVPCHRVIGADGSLTGYAGGLAVKAELLDRERAGA
jgi:AraC family transcriptional regulator, regulatory protein of adaptative response / methylated-DNA-[protein]-cysteine methyltransferase